MTGDYGYEEPIYDEAQALALFDNAGMPGYDNYGASVDTSADLTGIISTNNDAPSDPFATTAMVNEGWNGDGAGYGTADNPFYTYIGGPSGTDVGLTGAGQTLATGLGNAWTWFNGQKDQTKSSMIALGGSFLQGFFSKDSKERAIKAQEKMADAAMLRAQSESSTQEKKFANASAIGKTNFGAPNPKGLIYSNKLVERQKRAGYTGV